MVGRAMALFAVGVALLFVGVRIMSTGLKLQAEGRVHRLLSYAGVHPCLGVLLGMVVTALIQSSSAVTVMLVSMTEAGVITFHNAFAITLGANIGTTLTGFIMALSVGELGFWSLLAGLLLIIWHRQGRSYTAGLILVGCGLILLGMQIMGYGSAPLGEWEYIARVLEMSAQNQLFGLLTGTVATALLQSSSVFTGIVMALAKEGLVGLTSAALFIMGSNVGTCVTALLASIGTDTAARQTAVGHLVFNLFSILIAWPFLGPLVSGVEAISSHIAVQVASFQLLFNLLTVLAALPLFPFLVALVQRLVPR